MISPLARLSDGQRGLLDTWLPGFAVERDLSWGLVDTRVLQVSYAGSDFVVKAAGPTDGHLEREVRAHRDWLRPWTAIGRAPELVHHDLDASILVTRYLPGELVLGTPAQDDRATYEQAGELLALLHEQGHEVDETYEARENARTLDWLDRPHRIDPALVERLRLDIAAWPTPPVTLVPTHGDWQPRNWLVHNGIVSIIDFGRAAMRPADTDFARLARQDFDRAPRLEEAFLRGYGSDPRNAGAWRRAQLREAISTAAWAHRVGDEAFEQLGLEMLARLTRRDPESGLGHDRVRA